MIYDEWLCGPLALAEGPPPVSSGCYTTRATARPRHQSCDGCRPTGRREPTRGKRSTSGHGDPGWSHAAEQVRLVQHQPGAGSAGPGAGTCRALCRGWHNRSYLAAPVSVNPRRLHNQANATSLPVHRVTDVWQVDSGSGGIRTHGGRGPHELSTSIPHQFRTGSMFAVVRLGDD